MQNLFDVFNSFKDVVIDLINMAIHAFTQFLVFVLDFLGMIKVFVLQVHALNVNLNASGTNYSTAEIFSQANIRNVSVSNFDFMAVNLKTIIGGLRYLLGESIFMMMKLSALMACGFVIYKLAYMIYKYIKNSLNGVSSNLNFFKFMKK